MIVGGRPGVMGIFEASDLLGFSPQLLLQFTQNGVKNKKTSSEWQFCRQKQLVGEKGQRRIPDWLELAERLWYLR